MRIDLHVHSKQSRRPSQWILKKIECPESFSEPRRIYEIAKMRGMTHVTITDHNCIDGALEIAHLPGTFISEEVTTYFPEDGCKLHVLALDISEAQHEEIQHLRENVHELTAFMQKEHIFHIIAHPLYAVNDRLTPDNFERLLLLFQNFELNGARNNRENLTLKTIVNRLSIEDIHRISDKHGIEPGFSNPHQKRLFGGSDDHSSLNIARTYTEFIDAQNAEALLSATEEGRIVVHTKAPSPRTMAHNLYGIAWQFYRNRFNLDRYANKDPLVQFMDRSLTLEPALEQSMLSRVYHSISAKKRTRIHTPLSDSLAALLRRETQMLIEENPELLTDAKGDIRHAGEGEHRWFQFVSALSSRVMIHFGNHLLDHLSGANVFNIFHTLGSAGGLTTLLAPYFVAFSQFNRSRDLGTEIARRFEGPGRYPEPSYAPPVKVAHFTDTYYDINGVALTLQQQVRMAVKNGYEYTLITCDDGNRSQEKGVKHFKPIGAYRLPEYEQLKIFYPPVLEMLDYCHRQEFNHIHTATPGPIGLAALLVSRFLDIPISGTYHTAIPQYVQILTGSAFMEELAWKFVLWYYDQMNLIYAPSESTKAELVEKGISSKKIRIYPRGIDVHRFHPEKRNGVMKKWNCREETTKLLYVGRVSKEKNLPLLLEAYRELVRTATGLQLIVVGDGPYLSEMVKSAEDLPCIFTGAITGDELAAVYASCDIFVFPSATDTFGNAVLEAQASGLPVIVTDQGGPCENIIPGKTGLVVEAGCGKSLLNAMTTLTQDSSRRIAMGRTARAEMENRSFEAAFNETWNMFGSVNEKECTIAWDSSVPA